MFNSAFDDVGAKEGNNYPKELRAEIDEVNSRIYAHLKQTECMRRVLPFLKPNTIDGREGHGYARVAEKARVKATLSVADNLTESDILLITRLIRFDAVHS